MKLSNMRKITPKEQKILQKFIKKMYDSDRFVVFAFTDTPFGTAASYETHGVSADDLSYINNILEPEFNKLRANEKKTEKNPLEHPPKEVLSIVKELKEDLKSGKADLDTVLERVVEAIPDKLIPFGTQNYTVKEVWDALKVYKEKSVKDLTKKHPIILRGRKYSQTQFQKAIEDAKGKLM